MIARREEREQEFAPPQMYANDQAPVSSHKQQRSAALRADRQPLKPSSYDSQRLQSESRTADVGSSAADTVAAKLRSIRSEVEQSRAAASTDKRSTSAALSDGKISSDEAQPSLVDFTTLSSRGAAANFSDQISDSNYENQTSSWANGSSAFLNKLSSTGIAVEQPCETLSPMSTSICDLSTVNYTTSCSFSEAEITSSGLVDVCSGENYVAPQPAHYSSAPSGPQPKMPKYERIFLHDLPPTLPLPPTAGSAATQYPSQEEVIGPKRRKEPNEKDAIRNWFRQFDQQQQTKAAASAMSETGLKSDSSNSQLLKPKNIPFASPYIQTNDASVKVSDDPAAKEFDPSKPPPSVSSNNS